MTIREQGIMRIHRKGIGDHYSELKLFARRVSILLAFIPALILIPAAWFIMTVAFKTIAQVQLVAEASKTGLLDNPVMKELAKTMFHNNQSYNVFLLCAAVSAVLCIGFAYKARGLSRPACPEDVLEEILAPAPAQPQSTTQGEDSLGAVASSVSPFFSAPSEKWKNHAYPLALFTIQAQGTSYSRRDDMIAALEKALARLKAGESSGEESDDDFGYRFVESKAMNASIFKG